MAYAKQEIDAYTNIRARIIGARLFLAIFIGLVFVGLKLFNAITWPWWWVTSPIWGGIAYLIVGLIALAAYTAAMGNTQRKTGPPTAATPGLKAVPNTSTGKPCN